MQWVFQLLQYQITMIVSTLEHLEGLKRKQNPSLFTLLFEHAPQI